jgi:hypothetical protein
MQDWNEGPSTTLSFGNNEIVMEPEEELSRHTSKHNVHTDRGLRCRLLLKVRVEVRGNPSFGMSE